MTAVIACTLLSWRQTEIWRDDEALFGRALAVTTDNYFAHYNLANHFLRTHQLVRAEKHFRETLRIQPQHAKAAANLGVTLAQQAIRKPLQTEDIVGAVLFLGSDHSKLTTGQTIMVDGGTVFL